MDVRAALRSQYHAALDMLGAAVDACPDDRWDRPSDVNRSWQLAYHALFFTHFYLQPSEADFVPWSGHRPHLQVFGDRLPWPPHDPIERGAPLAKADVRAYLAACRAEVDARLATIDLEGPSGFPWLPMTKLEHMLYTLRHLMHHTGELYERLADTTGGALPWVGMGGAGGR